MNFYKNGKDTYFCDDPRFIIIKDFSRSWGVFEATDKPGNFIRVSGFCYLKDAKADVKRRAKA